jgi:hypothetical protein
MLAVATASWMARLIPTPPTGDMACAASPMHTRPGRKRWRSHGVSWSHSALARERLLEREFAEERPAREGAAKRER